MSIEIVNAVARYVPEVILVMMFMWFILRRDSLSQREMHTQMELWIGFLREQREQTVVALGRLAEEIKLNTVQIITLASLLTSHDAKANAAINELTGRQRREREKTAD